MATYASYKKITNDMVLNGAITQSALSATALNSWDVKWFFGQPCACSTGCCCQWTVPTGVTKMFIEAWGSGGSGHGACSCDRCHHYQGASGGFYNSISINTAPGCQYTVCAAGDTGCCRFECCGCIGCASYVTGFNLSGFCAVGGTAGLANTAWSTACFTEFYCCVAPTANGGDFGMGNHPGMFNNSGLGICHCWCKGTYSTGAPFIGADVTYHLSCCWMRCGCWTVPYGAGGQGAMSVLCGTSCCGQGGMGGPGLVKITFY
jgi:hypothetical protein